MSQFLLYISLLITAPVATGAENEFGVKGEVDSVIFALAGDENPALTLLSQTDSDLDSIVHESDTVFSLRLKPDYSLYQFSQTLSFSHPAYKIRAPPLTS